MIELCKPYYMQLLTNFTRQILNKRMPKLNGYQGEEKGLQSTMTREHMLSIQLPFLVIQAPMY